MVRLREGDTAARVCKRCRSSYLHSPESDLCPDCAGLTPRPPPSIGTTVRQALVAVTLGLAAGGVLLVVALGVVVYANGLPPLWTIGVGYEVVVVNRSAAPVEVFVDGARVGPAHQAIEGCSQHLFDLPSRLVAPREPCKVEVRDLRANVLLAEHRPSVLLAGGLRRLTISVPETPGAPCPQIRLAPTPTPWPFLPR